MKREIPLNFLLYLSIAINIGILILAIILIIFSFTEELTDSQITTNKRSSISALVLPLVNLGIIVYITFFKKCIVC